MDVHHHVPGLTAEAPNKDAAIAVHREAHGLVADEITEVKEGR